LHCWLIDKTGLIPDKFSEVDGIGIYRSAKHVCETFESFGVVLPARVITDDAQARDICRMLGVTPTDEQVIAAPLPVHAPAGTTDRQAWALGLLGRLSMARCDDYDEWVRVGMSLREFGGAGLAMWDTWSRGSRKYKPGECGDKWATLDRNVTRPVTLGSLYRWAEEDAPGR
jgi:hypothetical protein